MHASPTTNREHTHEHPAQAGVWWSVAGVFVVCAVLTWCYAAFSGSKSLLSLSRASSGGSGGSSPAALAAADASEAAETAEPVTPQPAAPLGADVAEGDPAATAGPKAGSGGSSAPVSPVSSATGSDVTAGLPRAAEDPDPATASLAMQRSRSAMFVGSCNLDGAEATVDRGFSSWSAAEQSPSCRSSLDVAGVPGGVAGAMAQHEALQEEASAAEELKEMLKVHPPQRSRPASRRPSRRTRAESGDHGLDISAEASSAALLVAERASGAVASSSATAEEAADACEQKTQPADIISRGEMETASSGEVPKARAASLPLPGSKGGSLPPSSRKKTGSRTKLDSFDKMLAKTAGGAQEVRLHAPPADRSFLPAWLAAPLRIRRSTVGGGGGSGSGSHAEDPSRRSSVSGDVADGPAAPRRSADWGRLLSPVAEAAQQQQQQQQRPPPSAFARRPGRFPQRRRGGCRAGDAGRWRTGAGVERGPAGGCTCSTCATLHFSFLAMPSHGTSQWIHIPRSLS